MPRHELDPLSAALGVIASAIGVLVMTSDAAGFDAGLDTGWLSALAVLLLGLGLIPWNIRRARAEAGSAEPADDEPEAQPAAE